MFPKLFKKCFKNLFKTFFSKMFSKHFQKHFPKISQIFSKGALCDIITTHFQPKRSEIHMYGAQLS